MLPLTFCYSCEALCTLVVRHGRCVPWRYSIGRRLGLSRLNFNVLAGVSDYMCMRDGRTYPLAPPALDGYRELLRLAGTCERHGDRLGRPNHSSEALITRPR